MTSRGYLTKGSAMSTHARIPWSIMLILGSGGPLCSRKAAHKLCWVRVFADHTNRAATMHQVCSILRSETFRDSGSIAMILCNQRRRYAVNRILPRSRPMLQRRHCDTEVCPPLLCPQTIYFKRRRTLPWALRSGADSLSPDLLTLIRFDKSRQ